MEKRKYDKGEPRLEFQNANKLFPNKLILYADQPGLSIRVTGQTKGMSVFIPSEELVEIIYWLQSQVAQME